MPSLVCAAFFRVMHILVIRTRALRRELVEGGSARDDAHGQREHLVSVAEAPSKCSHAKHGHSKHGHSKHGHSKHGHSK